MGAKIGLLKKISRKIGFTETESKIIIFLVTALMIGSVVSFIKNRTNENILEYNYQTEDNLFNNAGNTEETTDSSLKIIDERVDYQRELLDFRGEKIEKNSKNQASFRAEIIDINTAGEDDFASLEGIGAKTARNIVDYRSKNGRFINIEEMMNVKGIGAAKYEKIKNRITVK